MYSKLLLMLVLKCCSISRYTLTSSSVSTHSYSWPHLCVELTFNPCEAGEGDHLGLVSKKWWNQKERVIRLRLLWLTHQKGAVFSSCVSLWDLWLAGWHWELQGVMVEGDSVRLNLRGLKVCLQVDPVHLFDLFLLLHFGLARGKGKERGVCLCVWRGFRGRVLRGAVGVLKWERRVRRGFGREGNHSLRVLCRLFLLLFHLNRWRHLSD